MSRSGGRPLSLQYAFCRRRDRLFAIPLDRYDVKRPSLRAEKIDRYFDFKLLKICVHANISYTFE
jgi:hypothetical protein